jgi:carboxyl-terminal processing protease
MPIKIKWSCHRTDEKNYNSFKTRKGRSVYDGGGVIQEIKIKK